MIIREMIADDISELAQLYRQFWNEESCVETMHKQFNKFQKNDLHILISAIENNKLIGSVMGVICEELYGDCKPFLILENMIVDNNYRNKGVGKALISMLEEIATKRNCTQVILVTESNRIDACKFYGSVGYSPQTHKGFKKKLK
ncbi:MAG TPA: GNAT family N-acetyltransferase [Desulfosporosinus sp.]|nr:GNAT family N-acetyltransferase [Desulfosporosinus sp.]